MIVSTAVESPPVPRISPVIPGVPPVGISPVSPVELEGGGAAPPVEGTSPARAVAESIHAIRTAVAKSFILGFSFELRNASRLARKQHSVNTYSAIDTAFRGGE